MPRVPSSSENHVLEKASRAPFIPHPGSSTTALLVPFIARHNLESQIQLFTVCYLSPPHDHAPLGQGLLYPVLHVVPYTS